VPYRNVPILKIMPFQYFSAVLDMTSEINTTHYVFIDFFF